MECVKIFPLKHLTNFQHEQIWAARLEAGKVWNQCRDIHLEARRTSQNWPNRTDLQKATKGVYAMHSQSVPMICHSFLQNVDTTRQLRKSGVKIRYPYKTKHTYTLMGPAQAVKVKENREILQADTEKSGAESCASRGLWGLQSENVSHRSEIS